MYINYTLFFFPHLYFFHALRNILLIIMEISLLFPENDIQLSQSLEVLLFSLQKKRNKNLLRKYIQQKREYG